MSTYDGSKIVTGALYEDGTIEVKDGLVIEKIYPKVDKLSVANSKVKTKVIPFSQQPETQMGLVNSVSVGANSRQK